MQKICPQCSNSFFTKNQHQIYCSKQCQRKYYKKIYYHRVTKRNISNTNSILRQFYCAKCHKLIFIYDSKDKRYKFCSPHCEKLYWKHR